MLPLQYLHHSEVAFLVSTESTGAAMASSTGEPEPKRQKTMPAPYVFCAPGGDLVSRLRFKSIALARAAQYEANDLSGGICAHESACKLPCVERWLIWRSP